MNLVQSDAPNGAASPSVVPTSRRHPLKKLAIAPAIHEKIVALRRVAPRVTYGPTFQQRHFRMASDHVTESETPPDRSWLLPNIGGEIWGAIVEDVILFRNGVVLDQDTVMNPNQGARFFLSLDPRRYKRFLSRAPIIDATAVMLCDRQQTNIYHFLAEICPKVIAIEEFAMTPSESAFVAAPIAVNVEALRCLGVDGDRIMTADAESPLRARRAIVIQNFAQPFGPHTISARVAAAIRSRLTPGMAAKRIYIDRRTAVRRRCTNESKLIERLEGLGFRAIAPERLPFTEKAALFSAAEMVVAPHAAGLAHVMFAPPGVKVLEIVTNLWSPDM